jgi:hypothetical protein
MGENSPNLVTLPRRAQKRPEPLPGSISVLSVFCYDICTRETRGPNFHDIENYGRIMDAIAYKYDRKKLILYILKYYTYVHVFKKAMG